MCLCVSSSRLDRIQSAFSISYYMFVLTVLVISCSILSNMMDGPIFYGPVFDLIALSIESEGCKMIWIFLGVHGLLLVEGFIFVLFPPV